MRPEPFAGKVVAITGAGGGLGSALARRFAAAGATLALLDLSAPEALAAELAAAGTQTVALDCDVTDVAGCAAAIRQVEQGLGGVDVLVNNAGITHRSPFANTDPDVLRRVMEVNYFGAVHVTHAAVASLQARRGQVISISSVAGFAPLLGRTGYVASKHALEGFMSTLREELASADVDVDVLVVRPGFVATGMSKRALDERGAVAKHDQQPVGKRMSPQEAADQIVRAAARGQRELVLTSVGKMSWWLTRLVPRAYAALMRRSQRAELARV